MNAHYAENLNFFIVLPAQSHVLAALLHVELRRRQNDIQGNGEVNYGNWISGIPPLSTIARLGDQSLLPADQGSENKGHNVFYMLPLLLGIIGIGWQAFVSKRGIEQFCGVLPLLHDRYRHRDLSQSDS